MRRPIRTIVHLSDFHFGNTFDFLLEPLLRSVAELSPDLLVVSGDFVEHATTEEFELARDYLSRLPKPQLVVPGNHDLPFYDPLKRYRQGLSKYLLYISRDLSPVFSDSEMIVAGLSTPRIFPLKGGRINAGQLASVEKAACGVTRSRVRVLVTHHPLDLPATFGKAHLAGRARMAVEKLSYCVDLMLAGHLHLSSVGATAARYKTTGHSLIFAQAGTAISRRNKGEPNSFNVIRLQQNHIEISHHRWDGKLNAFKPGPPEHFDHGQHGWSKILSPTDTEQVQIRD